MADNEALKANLSSLLGAHPAVRNAPSPQDELPEEEALPEALVGKDKSKKKKTVKDQLPKGDLSMPQTKEAGNKVKYQEVGSQLHYHTSTGNWEVVEELLDTTPGAIECRSQDGRTILHVASSLGHKKIVTELLARGVEINSQMQNGITPLMLCVAQGQNEIVSLLLEHKPAMNVQSTKDGYTALHLAVMHQQLAGAKLLLEHEKKINPHPLEQKVEEDVSNNQLSDSKGRKKAKKSSSKVGNAYIDLPSLKGYTALHLAIVENEKGMIQLLLEHRANPMAVTLRNWYPIHFAAHIGNEDTCKMLLALDDSMPLLKNDVGERPLCVATAKGHEHLYVILDHKKLKKSSSKLIRRGSSFTKRSKKKKEEVKKETIIIDNTQKSLLEMFELPEFAGKEGESVIDAIAGNPALLQQMKDNPAVFLKYLPRDMQELLIRDVERNPMLLQEVVEIGKEVMMKVIEEHPEQLLSAMQNPFQLFKRANTPAKLMKLVKQLESNPMSVLKDEFQEDPELFLIKELRDNPRLLFLVVERVRETKPHLLPLIRVVIGVNPDDAKEPEFKEKGIAGKMKSKVVKATVNKFMKKMSDTEDPDLEKLDLGGLVNLGEKDSEELDKFRAFMNADAATTLKEAGIGGPLFTTEEYYVKIDKDGNEIKDEEPEVPLPNPDQEQIAQLEKHAEALDLD